MYKLALDFIKVGFLTFGGGSSVIPIIDEYIVRKGVITEEEYLEIIMIANVLPGPSMLQIASIIGYLKHKVLGAVLCGVAISVLPILVFMFAIIFLYDHIDPSHIFLLTVPIFIVLGISSINTGINLSKNIERNKYYIIGITLVLLQVFHIPSPILIIGGIILVFVRSWFK